MNLDSGYIKLFRSIQENPLWNVKPYDKARAWIDLLLLANHKTCEVLIKGEIVVCNRGEVLRSLNYYQNRWGWTKQKVRSYFILLVKLKMIQKKNAKITTHLTISNYNKFQESLTKEQHTSNTSTTLYNKSNKVKTISNNDKFDIFWLKYPNKKSKKKALQIWINKKLDKNFNDIITGLNNYKKTKQWMEENGKYIPHPTTFLNQERWNDDFTIKVPQDNMELNIKKENMEFKKKWIELENQSASPEEAKNILAGWKNKKMT